MRRWRSKRRWIGRKDKEPEQEGKSSEEEGRIGGGVGGRGSGDGGCKGKGG